MAAAPGAAKSEAAEKIHQSPASFVAEAFDAAPPPPRRLWLDDKLQKSIEPILGHRYGGVGIRYWRRGARTAWVLEEIGKYRPITAGFIVEAGQMARVRVLVYRESHGWEIRYPFFTDQFTGMRLDDEGRPDRDIDNISGATLSVGALTRLARLALFLNRWSDDDRAR